MTSPFTADASLAPLPEKLDPWSLFGMEERAQIDAGELKRAYLDLSRKLHPDRFQAKGGEQAELALAWSTALNDAYRTLKETPARLEALLRAHKLMPAEGTQNEKTPQDLLMEVFELRETLEDLGDAAPNDAQRADLQEKRDDFSSRMSALKTELDTLAASWDEALDQRAKTAQSIVEAFGYRRFFQRLLGELDKALAR